MGNTILTGVYWFVSLLVYYNYQMANGLNPEASFSCLSGVIVWVRERLLLVTDVSTSSAVVIFRVK